MASSAMTRDEILDLLRRHPALIESIVAGLSADQLRASTEEDGWSVSDVLAHLRACADVWGGCIARIIAEDTPAIRAISPRTWIKRTDYPSLEFSPSFSEFVSQRCELVSVLEALSVDDWSRKAVVTKSGNIRDWTVLAYAQLLAEHERIHLVQIEEIANVLRMGNS